MRRFFKALGPATLGSAGTQIALFADTIIASFLAAGAISALYYADRLDQLPIGVIGIAVGTVLLPEMTHRLAAGDEPARAARRTAPSSSRCCLQFPARSLPGGAGSHHARLFLRGAFHRGRRACGGATLVAYTLGLIPFVLLRSVVAPFLARGDTATPVKALLIGAAVNVVLKVALMGR